MLAATDSAASALWEMTSTSDSPEGCSAQQETQHSSGCTRQHRCSRAHQRGLMITGREVWRILGIVVPSLLRTETREPQVT